MFKKPCASEGILRRLWREAAILSHTKQAHAMASANFAKFWPSCAPLLGAFGVGLEGLVWLLVDVVSF